jgi:hypothetical protein
MKKFSVFTIIFLGFLYFVGGSSLVPPQEEKEQEAFDALYIPTLPPPTTSSTECDGVYLTVTLLTDGFGNEVSWNVKNGGETILSSDGETYGNNLQYIASTCVPECDGEYTFSIFDSYGDGLYSPGSYTVTLDGVVKAQGGGDYGSEEITEFSGDCSPATSPPTPSPTPVPVPPTPFPTIAPPTPTSSPTGCDGLYLTVTLITDGYGSDVSWNMTKDGLAILSSDGETYGNNLQYLSSTCVPEECEGDYTFSIFDSYGDGLYSPGSYTVTLDGVVKAQGGDDYGSEEIKDFSGCDDTPTTSPTGCDELELSVALLTDGYGSDVSWNVTKDGLAILSSDGETYGNNQEYLSSTCVPEECDGDYTFSIFDSWGDGLGWGEPGSYTVTLGGVVKA